MLGIVIQHGMHTMAPEFQQFHNSENLWYQDEQLDTGLPGPLS